MVVGLAVTPFIVGGLGDEGFGAFQVTTAYLGYVGLLALGVDSALVAAVARAAGRGDSGRVVALLRAGSRTFFWCGLLTAAVALGLAAVVTTLVVTGPGVATGLRLGLVIAALGGLLLPVAVYRPFADARQRGHVTHLAMFAQGLTISAFSLALVATGWGVVGMFAATLIGATVAAAILVRDGAAAAPPAAVLLGPIDPTATAELARLNGWTLLLTVLGRFGVHSDAIILSLFADTAAVTPFVLTLRLSGIASAQLSAIGGSSWAALAELHFQNLPARMNARLVQLTRATAFLGLAMLIPIAVWNGPFVRAWVGAGRDAGWLVGATGAANAWMLSVVSLWVWVLTGTGQVRRVIPNLAVGTAVNVAVSVIATIWLGPVGPLVGTAAQLFGVWSWWLPLTLRRDFGTSPRALAVAVLGPLALGAPVALILVGVAGFIPIDDPTLPRLARIAGVGACMASAALLYVGLGWFTVIPAADRAELLARFRRRPTTAPPDAAS